MKMGMMEKIPAFLERLGLDEMPMGIFYTDAEPAEGLSPKLSLLPTCERESRNAIDWGAVFGNFSCVMGHIWRARRKKTAAWFSAERFGCPGGAFWLGFMKPQTETIIHYVSSGIPGHMEGEYYCESPDALGRTFREIDPPQVPKKFWVIKPLDLFGQDELPEFVTFFTRAEPLAGLHQLAYFVTNDPEVVASPWGAACAGLGTWPLKYREMGKNRAVIGGWDISARKFFRNDELSFTVPCDMFEQMLARYESSFLSRENWNTVVKKKIARSRSAWEKHPENAD